MREQACLPPDGLVRIDRDAASPLHAIRCARPCGSSKGCTLMSDARGNQPGSAHWSGGVCWLGSASTREGAEAYAARLGYRVVQP